MFHGIVDMPCPREPSTRHFLAWVLLEITETQTSHWHCQRRWRRSYIEQRGINLWLTRFSGPARLKNFSPRVPTAPTRPQSRVLLAQPTPTALLHHCPVGRMLRVYAVQGMYHKYFYGAPVLSLDQLQGRPQSHPRHHPRPYCPPAPRFIPPPP